MRKIRFDIKRAEVGNTTDCAYVTDDESPFEALVAAVIEDIRTDLEITISGVTMHLAAWQDPEHWATDWAHELGVDLDDAPEAVMALLIAADES